MTKEAARFPFCSGLPSCWPFYPEPVLCRVDLGVVLVFGLGIYLEIFLLIHALTILAFVLWLEEISFLAEDDKRKAIDLGYWILPLFLLGLQYVGLF